ncbi:MAG: hypothetical protein U5Q03_01075 [Bacteroidota bacterium]|nr:hypothetical protein [Bacteroidota bacterium]
MNILTIQTDSFPAMATNSLVYLQAMAAGNAEQEGSVAVITKITYLLFLFLILAIFIERSTEIFMSVLKYIDLKRGWYRFWNRQAQKFKTRLDRLYGFQGGDTEDKKLLYRWILWKIVSEKPYTGGKDIVAARSVRTQYYRISGRLFALILSLIFSVWVYLVLEIDLVSILNKVSGTTIVGNFPAWIKIILTAAILTAGSEPMHQLIVKAEKIGKNKKQNS